MIVSLKRIDHVVLQIITTAYENSQIC